MGKGLNNYNLNSLLNNKNASSGLYLPVNKFV